MSHPVLLSGLRAAVLVAVLPACSGSSGKETATDSDPGGSGSGSGTGGGDVLPCDDPQPIVDATGAASGLVRCADGAINRTAAVAADPTFLGEACAGTEAHRSCDTDADCTEHPNGHCGAYVIEGDGDLTCGCQYTCATDADCTEDQVCLPAPLVDSDAWGSRCVSASCTTDDACMSDQCGVAPPNTVGSSWWTIGCRTEDDTCRTHDDCETSDQAPYVACMPGYDDDAFTCESTGVPGRPLSIRGQAHTAAVRRRADWATPVPIPAPTAVRAWWARVAAAEHASVASFGRVALELMALGAPPDLLMATQAAAMDEIRHAKAFFGLASQAAGLGPGAIPMQAIELRTTPAAFLDALLREACVNETLAAAEALAAAQACQDSHVKAVLAEVARDESRHAALAWRTLRWLLEQHPELEARAAWVLADALCRRPLPMAAESAVPELGVLDVDTLCSVQDDAIVTVVEPAARALGLC